MEPRTGIDGFAPGPLVTRTGPCEASRPMAEPVVRCRPGWRGAARRRGPVAAPHGHGTERAGPPFPPNCGLSSGRPVASAGVMPLASPAWRWDSARQPLVAVRRPAQPRLTRRAGDASSPGQAHRLARSAAWATAAVVRGSGALSPTPGSKLLCASHSEPLHVPSQLAVWLKALSEVSTCWTTLPAPCRTGAAQPSRLHCLSPGCGPVFIWLCARGWAPGEGLLLCFCFCVEDPKVGKARQGGRVEIGSDCRICRRRG